MKKRPYYYNQVQIEVKSNMCFRGLEHLPVFLVLVSVATFFVTYIIAISKNDVSPYFPYISDTGTKPPESCIFGQFLNVAAALALWTMYVRFKLVQALAGEEDSKLRRLNKVSFVLGVFSSLGLSLVANFQETQVEPVHITGAALVFGFGVVYAFLQTWLSYHMFPDYNGIYICRIRLVISVASLICMIITFSAATVSRVLGHPKDRLHWKPEDPGFNAHIISTFGEWITAVTFLCFFFTYIRDFQKVKVEIRARLSVRHLDEAPLLLPNESTRVLA